MATTKNHYSIKTGFDQMQLAMIHDFLSKEAYWCENIPRSVLEKAMQHSMCFGIFESENQLGFARVVSDYATVAYLADVFILKEHRGKGLSQILLQKIMNHSELQGLRRWILVTGDAHSLYEKFEWKKIKHPERWMEIHHPASELYK